MCSPVMFVTFCFFFFIFLSASVRTDIIDSLCNDYDGRDRRYCTPVGRGRNRLAFGYILDITHKLVSHSGLFAPSRILVYRTWNHISLVNSIHVPASHSVLDY